MDIFFAAYPAMNFYSFQAPHMQHQQRRLSLRADPAAAPRQQAYSAYSWSLGISSMLAAAPRQLGPASAAKNAP
jgi:hypothetical protein